MFLICKYNHFTTQTSFHFGVFFHSLSFLIHAPSLVILSREQWQLKRTPSQQKVPVISIEEMKIVNGNLIGGQVAATNHNVFNVYAYSLPTFDLLKKPIYQDVLDLSRYEATSQ